MSDFNSLHRIRLSSVFCILRAPEVLGATTVVAFLLLLQPNIRRYYTKLKTKCMVVLHRNLNMEVGWTDRATGLSATPEPNLQCSFDCVQLSRKLTLPTRKRHLLQMSAPKNTPTELESIRAVMNKSLGFLLMNIHYIATSSYASLAG